MRDILDKLNSLEEDLFQIGDDFGISLSEDFEIGTTIVGFTNDGIVVDLDETALDYLTQNGIMFVEGVLEEGLKDPKDNPCWKGYKPVGTKKKGGKTVPNCVPKESIEEDYDDVPANPDEAEMAMSQLNFIEYASDEIKEYLAQQQGGFPEWFQNKLSGIFSEIRVLHSYIEGKRYGNESVDEAEYQGRNVQLGKKMPGDVKKYKVYVRNPKGNVVKVNFGDKKMRIKKSNPKRRKSFRARHNCANPGPRHKARYWSCRNW